MSNILKAAYKDKILKSIIGLIIIIIIMLSLILTANYLKPILFGLLLSYISLPLYYFLEKNIFYKWKNNNILNNKNNITILFINIIKKISKKLLKIISLLKNNKSFVYKNNKIKKIQSLNISYILTIIIIIFILLSVIIGISWITTTYISKSAELIAKSNNIQSIKLNPENITDIIKNAKTTILESNNLNILHENTKKILVSFFSNPDNILYLISYLIDYKEISIQTTITNFILSSTKIFFNILLTIFFFIFFLRKLIIFNHDLGNKTTSGEHIIESIINTKWLPNINIETKKYTITILDEIFLKLKIWIRGYIVLTFIEIILYTIIFSILKIPFCLILGIFAGCSILLPYIGTIISATITIIIYITLGNANIIYTIILILTYLIVSGIIDQLILYPIIIGNALELNLLEIITFILLGGIFGGILGMIFAVPILSITKHIIPYIYAIFNNNKKITD